MGAHGEPAGGWRRRRTGRSWAVLLVLVAAFLATRASQVRAIAPVSIEIKDSRYVPSTVTVDAGTTVRWTNRDEETHTVTSTSGQFGSSGLDLDETYTHTFSAPGTYAYGCDLHPFMEGTIVVR
jgi:plastocyanin